jgi:tryptophanyl-tRNA synthetase
MKRILSGINPSSSKGLHLGNYLGAVKRFVSYQKDHECFFFVANLHALNSIFDPKAAVDNAYHVFLEYLAFGIDPTKSTFYIESDIPEITYLQTILNNCVTVAEMQRMHGYKDKMAKEADQSTINIGLFNYPILMAADILLFSPDVVPVGEDQTQHVEICREIGRTFNNRYGQTLHIPELAVEKTTARIIGTDGVRKMSKSLGNIIDPLDVAEKYGADAVRMSLVIGTGPGNDSKMSEDKIKAYKHFANKLWNITRFILTYTDTTKLEKNFQNFTETDLDLIKERNELVNTITKEITEYKFYLASDKIYQYTWARLADVILEESRPIYANGTNEEKNHST